MRTSATFVFLLSLAACSPPLKAETPESFAASSVAPSGPTEFVIEARKPEAASMAAHPGYARRDGDVLTLSFNGKDVARLTDKYNGNCEGFETCSAWFFNGTLDTGGKTYVQVNYFNGENWLSVLFDTAGHDEWLEATPMASPEGRFIAAGVDQDSLSGGFLQIVDWSSHDWPKPQYESSTPCEPQKWLSATSLDLTCGNASEPVPHVTAKRQPDGTWTLSPGDYPPLKLLEQKPHDPKTNMGEPSIGLERLVTQ